MTEVTPVTEVIEEKPSTENVVTEETVIEKNEEVTPEAISEESTEVDDDEDYGWKQEDIEVAPKAEVKAVEEVKVEVKDDSEVVKQLKQENDALKLKLENLESSLNNPFFSAWEQYLGETSTPNVSEFLTKLGLQNRASNLKNEELLEQYYTKQAKLFGIDEEEIEEIVYDKINQFSNLDKLEQKKHIAQIKREIDADENKGIEQTQKDWEEKNRKKIEENNLWIDKQKSNIKNQIDAIVSKGKFNNRNVDNKWGKTIFEQAMNSKDLLEICKYTPKGDLIALDAVDIIDRLVNREELKSISKKVRQSALAENLVETAAVAHTSARAAEAKANMTQRELDDLEYERARKSYLGGK